MDPLFKSFQIPLFFSFHFTFSFALMASSVFSIPFVVFVSLVIAVHLPPTVTADFLSLPPLLSPIFGDVCKQVSCGKGNCALTKNNTIPFECVCENGWKQPTSVNGFKFLPCVIPNCTIDVSCSKAASPEAAPRNTTKEAMLDPCNWNVCGSGTCNRSSSNSSYSYSCSCSEGYYNLMNSTSLPCYPECALGGDCQKLGISIFNQSAHAPALSADNTTNLAKSLQHGKLSWVIGLMMFASITIFA